MAFAGAPASPLRVRASYGTLTRFGDRLSIAGRRRVVAVGAGSGQALWVSAEISGRRRAVDALVASSRIVYVGGSFTTLGSTRRVGLAGLDASTGRLLPWRAPAVFQPSRGWVAGAVGHLALSSSRVYFAGNFRQLGPKRVPRANGVAAVWTRDGRSTGFSPRALLYEIGALAFAGRLVLVGGRENGGVLDSRTGALFMGSPSTGSGQPWRLASTARRRTSAAGSAARTT